MTAVRILLVDDHQGFLDGLRAYLRDFADLEVVGEALSGGEGLAEAHRLQPDVVLLDWNMPDLNGLQTLALLKKFAAAPRVVMLTLLPDLPRYRDAAIALGADGFVSKSDLDKCLVTSLRHLFALPDVTAGT